MMGHCVRQVLAGSAEFRALNTPDKDRPDEAKEVAKLYRQLYKVWTGEGGAATGT